MTLNVQLNSIENVLKWKIEKWDQYDYWLVTTEENDEPGINGAVMPNEFGGTVRDTINVDSYVSLLRKLKMPAGRC